MPPSIDRSLHWIGTWTLSAHILPLKRRRGLSTIFIFIVLSCCKIQLQSLAKAYTGNGKPSRKRLIPPTEREPRYFAQEALLPGLANLDELQPEFVVPGLPVLYTNDPKRVSDWLGDHVGPNGGTLGFDVESVPEIPHILRKATFRGPALVQLATPNASLVIQLARNNGRHSRACIPILEAVLADEHIIKAGVQVDLDMLELHQKWHTIEARSRLDLGGLLICEDDANRRPGLKRLAESVLGVNLPKSKSLAKSNWSQVPLSPAQIAYSARDAWAGAAIVEELVRLDPIIFERVSLVERLRSQRPIAELSVRLNKRREAKSLLSSLLAPYSFQKGSQVSVDELPPWKQKTVKNLRQQVRENKWDAMEVFDFEPLRFINGFNSTL